MKIQELIDQIIASCGTKWAGRTIEKETTRDQILWGDPEEECTGIVTSIFASVNVIKKAAEKGCNFIIVHEALFWNHGDYTDWLVDNEAFQAKKKLLDEYGICVWRLHDYIHAGVRLPQGYKDGIFYGLTTLMGWNDYILNREDLMPQDLQIPQIPAKKLAKQIREKFRLNAVRFIGDPDTLISRIHLPMHIMGRGTDNDLISKINNEKIDCLLTLEMVDFTVCEYIRDVGMLKQNKCIFALGHFNFEEIGMEYYAGYIREYLRPDPPVYFIQAGDSYTYL